MFTRESFLPYPPIVALSVVQVFLRVRVPLPDMKAHIGCFLPAEFASIRPCDALFARLSNDDDIETNASTFLVEMRDMAYILNHLTDQSIILVDELGRGTSTVDGLGISCAISEKLIQGKVTRTRVGWLALVVCSSCFELQCMTFFATHFHELSAMLEPFPSVVNSQLSVEVSRFSAR